MQARDAPFQLEPDKENSQYPKIWLGTWSLGGEGFGAVDARQSLLLLSNAIQFGIRHFDSAQFYAHGKSEALLARAIKHSGVPRATYFISTKGGLLWNGKQVVHDASPENLRFTLQLSLQTLKTDYIDLYQLHWPDPEIPITESIDSLIQLQSEGLIRYWGVGNFSARQIVSHCQTFANIPHQVHHNPLFRNDNILRAGHHQQRCFNCITSPFEQGLLTRRQYHSQLDGLGKKDTRRRNPLFSDASIHEKLTHFYMQTDGMKIPRSSLVLHWHLQQHLTDAVIVGCKTPGQWEEIAQALLLTDENHNWYLSNSELIDRLNSC